jgi:hypothetical protein
MNPGSRCRYGNEGRQTRGPYPKIQRFSVGGRDVDTRGAQERDPMNGIA